MSNAPLFWSELPDAQVGSNYKHSERPLEAIRKVVVKGSMDVYFRRSNVPKLLVSGETKEAADAVKTYLKGDKLIIDSDRSASQVDDRRNNVSIGYAAGDVHINGQKVHISGNGLIGGCGRAVVGIALPEIPAINIKGSAAITLLDLLQDGIELEISGSGDVTASGQVDTLQVSIAGSGDVDTTDLLAKHATLSITGSGDIRAHACLAATVRLAGSGDVVVRGNPTERSTRISGSGSVKFK